MKKPSKGFKKSMCRDKECLACNAAPPVLSAKIIKSLNTSFCKVSEKDTTVELLNKKVKKGQSGGPSLEGDKKAKDKKKMWV